MRRIHIILILFLSAAALLAFGIPCGAQQPTPKKKPVVQPAQQEPQEEYTEEEFDAYEKADKEADLDKRGPGLLAFMDKYPNSKLKTYIVTDYQRLMYDRHQAQAWAKLLPLAEAWLKYYPDDLQSVVYIAESAHALGQDQKYIEYALKIYSAKPDCDLAASMANSYLKIGDKAKSEEWTLKLFACPAYDGNYGIRMNFLRKYLEEKKLDKAADYAGQSLKALDLAKKPDDKSEADWRKEKTDIFAFCNRIIGLNYYEKQKYAEAIKALEKVIKVKKDSESYYYIGMCQWKIDQATNEDVSDAILSFALAIRCGGGEKAEEAKTHLEDLYKAIHNKTLIGVEKVYTKAERVCSGKPPE